jgi:hypothetical protein
MLAKWFLAVALFGGMVSSVPAVETRPAQAGSVQIAIRGKLSLIAPITNKDIRWAPQPQWFVDAGGQLFRVNLGKFHEQAAKLIGQQVIVRGQLDGDTVTVAGLEEPRDDALLHFVRVSIEGDLAREVDGVIPRIGEPWEQIVWRVRCGGTVYTLSFADAKVEAEALKLVGKKVVISGTLKDGNVHVDSINGRGPERTDARVRVPAPAANSAGLPGLIGSYNTAVQRNFKVATSAPK